MWKIGEYYKNNVSLFKNNFKDRLTQFMKIDGKILQIFKSQKEASAMMGGGH